ncbi:CRISPR-associated helicase Cas3' [Pectobacterium parmentieri]|uniref:CRISPR-associated helicase Cas3 n=1 Tax=Pectobacterium parmentieri TaxID=1905730 RepID=A0ABS0S1U5_PECPM|nr:CRISPR-associated helicase Cas3' [Pectobacterium parmentieri]MBI0471814.1 CRISPR-associated helicase Cas3' [Pectobacterium parmentieri]MBI0494499.1 CRISPR-associated helicase Cas3' [Pectobacterium parmentieri]MBI0555786.1 CRISPR-associated helicase Cas3' [Pectobacterium parmentieri]MBI0568828.1 CRISPR-associated helicase Cas3' [Pectobacterium parmentieri]MBI0573661.1 CRISPR-associated helicase Cas3' [Pectobacterium parmentieri]
MDKEGIIDRRYFHYWGKANRSTDALVGDDYHLLPYHCLDVAACGYFLLKGNYFQASHVLRELASGDDDVAPWFAYFLAWHDIGKFARGFQRKYINPDSPLVQASGQVDTARHDALGFWLWQERDDFPDLLPFSADMLTSDSQKTLDIWLNIVTGHHGKPPEVVKKGSLAFHRDDYRAVQDYLHDVATCFPEVSVFPMCFADKGWRNRLKQQSWGLAGLTVLADWLGSRQQDFWYCSTPMPLETYWREHALPIAEKVVSRLPRTPSPASFHSIQRLFPFMQQPTPLQQKALEADISADGPQLFILEDVTGAGKTEAAMILAHRLMAQRKASGIYVGLPTMATANAMYKRLAQAYRALYSPEHNPSLMLAHGARHMSSAFMQSLWEGDSQGQAQYDKEENAASKDCNIWFADSRKKALLADIGVGTLDQALMAVMPFRHQSLRVLGLQNKLLILDEVHAYDAYMSKLIELLIGFHAQQGGSVIILTATLPLTLREKLTRAFAAGIACEAAPPDPNATYPWLTQLTREGLRETKLETRKEVRREVKIGWLTERLQGIDCVKAAVAAGQSIAWIRNTVGDAIAVYRQLIEAGVAEDNMLLFHSRFAFCDRMAIEERALAWFGKDSMPNERAGKVLIATQVVEQSLDIDVDNMISDLAPIDLLIQRAGRLQRHIRFLDGRRKTEADAALLTDERPAAVLHIMAPVWQTEAEADWLGDELRNSGYVYPDHAALWRTQAILRECGAIKMPEAARLLINSVYEEQIAVPPALEAIANKVLGERYGQRSVASQSSLALVHGYCAQSSEAGWSDAVDISTRLGEETLDLYLAWKPENDGELPQPYATSDTFAWEQSRVQVRVSWWQKRKTGLPILEGGVLERFRQQLHRPQAEVLLLNRGENHAFYSEQVGLMLLGS